MSKEHFIEILSRTGRKGMDQVVSTLDGLGKTYPEPGSPYYSSVITLQRKLYEVRNSLLFYSFLFLQ